MRLLLSLRELHLVYQKIIDKPDLLFVKKSSTDVNNAKQCCVFSANQLFMDYFYDINVDETNRCTEQACYSTSKVSPLSES